MIEQDVSDSEQREEASVEQGASGPDLACELHHMQVRTEDRTVMGLGTFRLAPYHVGDDGKPTIDGGIGERDGCVIEQISAETLAAIHAAMPSHGGGVTISPDHTTITANPEPPEAAEAIRARQQRAADLATLAASNDPVHQALARLLNAR